jgi:alkylation response protein AidB-like acyl-CoA dehydrogenase
MERSLFESEHEMFRASFRSWLDAEVVPNHLRWEEEGITPHDLYRSAGSHGFLAMEAPEVHGGGGVDDFRFNLVITEEIADAEVMPSAFGISLHNDICLPYFLRYCTPEQADRWLPGIVSGDLVTAIAMTEPAIGSDLASMSTVAARDGESFVVNGSKTFITNGINADLVIVAVKTDPTKRHGGISLLVVERGTPGFERGRNLDKVGLHAQDTAELFFTDAVVPAENLLGEEGQGFVQLVANLPRERLSIAAGGVAGARAALRSTLAYVKERHAFGRPVGSFQASKFALAEMATEVELGQAFIDRCVEALDADDLTAEEAAMAKWWSTEMHNRVVDRCLQLHGGYGYMTEYPIARAYRDARITTIYGGTTEIMKEIIGRGLGL